MSSDHEKKPTDPLIEAQIERTLEPYRGVATPTMLRAMRAQLEELLSTHPTAVGLIEKLREPAAPDASGEKLKDGVKGEDKAGGGKEGA